MKRNSAAARLLMLGGWLALAVPLSAQSVAFVEGQRELGPIVVTELSIRDGKLAFRTASGGCTDPSSFAVDIVAAPDGPAGAPHYRLTIRRIRADDCKALLIDGVLIELDLAQDLGLTGRFSVVVTNRVLVKAR